VSSSTDTPCPDAFVALAERLAETTRSIIHPYFRQPIEIAQKADQSPVTIADREAEGAMRALIAEAYPEHGMIGEEHGAERSGAAYVWILDPIDGTKRFISGHPQFGTLIGLMHDGEPILGIIDMPMMDERWIGAAGRETIKKDANGTRPARVRPCATVEQAVLYATSPHMFPGDDFQAFERVRRHAKLPMYGGECYAYGLLSSGFVDLVIEATMEVYDYLPLVPVITGAGGVISDWQGAPLGLGSDGRTIAAGDRRSHAAAITMLHGR
jgi:inositol-phosphate phosphatase/L-galactose 1-phosphate phosphatase/histidinol-phosphatase